MRTRTIYSATLVVFQILVGCATKDREFGEGQTDGMGSGSPTTEAPALGPDASLGSGEVDSAGGGGGLGGDSTGGGGRAGNLPTSERADSGASGQTGREGGEGGSVSEPPDGEAGAGQGIGGMVAAPADTCEPGTAESCWAASDGTSLGEVPSDPLLGNCRLGTRICGTDATWGACIGAVAPMAADRCDEPGADDDCNGFSNEDCSCVVGDSRPCGTSVGNCEEGLQTCTDQGWGPCEGEVPAQAVDGCYEQGDDANCSGTPNEGCVCIGNETEACGECGTRACNPESGQWGPCMGADLTESCGEDATGALAWDGPTVGDCREGERVCQSDGTFSACVGAVGPESADDCAVPGDDSDCDGEANSGCPCVSGESRVCGSDVGACSVGSQTCTAGNWGTCQGAVGPKIQDSCAVEGDDSDCNGIENEGCPCIGTETGDCNDCGTRTCAPSQRSWGTCTRKQQIQECTPGTTTSVRTCSTTGTWTTTTCMHGCYGGQCGECQNGDVRCAGASNTIPQQCVNGAWGGSTPCTGSTPACLPASGTCGCATGSSRCLNATTPETCVAGSWEAQASCPTDAPVCDDGDCVCSNSALRCDPSGSAAARQICSNGAWQPTTACNDDDPVCIDDGQCGCVPADTRCEEPNTVANCNSSNDWVMTECMASLPACNGNGQCLSAPSVPGFVGCGGTVVCDVDEQCCYNGVSQTGVCEPDTPTGTTCATTGDLFEFDCDGPNDCGSGQVCCWIAYMRQVGSCLDTCSGIGASVLCDPLDGIGSNPACGAGQNCTATANGTMTLYRCQ